MTTTIARLDCDEQTARRLAAALGELSDNAAFAAFEREDRRWTVEITFDAAPDRSALRAMVGQHAGAPAATALQFDTIEERDWVAASLEGLSMVRAGRFTVHGAHHRAALPANTIGIEIEAALAFGTGHHGTTRGCLLALDRLAKRRRLQRVLDVGTGTGVLAIAAARRLRRKVCASDIDPVAVKVARGNAAHNRAGSFVTFAVGDAQRTLPWRGPFDLIMANILLGPLTRMARPLAKRLAPAGYVILSGLMPDQADAARSAYAAQGLVLEHHETLENWVTLTMRRGRVAT
ncbi:MAG TPA: 50S ribosomal protein L11 methyltransferase, partial [Vicinamibacterales bacterium]|nr:50S ribosomal protein L11 methyltransferase [Vicinamibacterales bacterium]